MNRGGKPLMQRRKSSTPHYQTFPTKPPISRGRPPSPSASSTSNGDPTRGRNRSSSSGGQHESPLPTRQLAVLAVIALAEQTALNSISPYLPDMTSTFPEVKEGQVGVYVGLIASSFALAQFATNFFWGWLSDRIGRKPVILTGTILTAACFVAFGFCRTLSQAIMVQVLMGLVNGNQGVVSTCLGEITDRSNQSKAFTYLPVVYGIGAITGPIVGGVLVSEGKGVSYPFLLPNLVAAAVLLVDSILAMLYLEESLEEAKDLPPLRKRIGNLFSRLWQFSSSSRPSYMRTYTPGQNHRGLNGAVDGCADAEDGASSSDSQHSAPAFFANHKTLSTKEIFNRDTVLLLITFVIFQLSNISYNSLYPIFAQAKPPTGRNLSPEEIGISLGFAGAVTIVFQIGLFGKLREKIGNKTTYRVGLGGFVVAFFLMPWVGYKDNGKVWLWIELGGVLIIKTLASVGGLTSALLLITNSAPDHSVLGTLNGLAQTLSAAGRAAGPFISGFLFTLATHVRPKGEALVFGIFAGVSFLGFLLSLGIKGRRLEDEAWDEEGGSSNSSDEDGASGDEEAEERALLGGRK